MKNALSLVFATLALSSTLAGCTKEAARPAQGSGDIMIGAPSSAPKQMVCAPGSFSGGNECIPVKPAECPPGSVLAEGVCVAQIPAGEAPLKQAASGGQATSGTLPLSFVDQDFGPEVDSRSGWQQPRSRQLMITEIQALEALFQSAPKDSPDRPKIMYRLATDYVELEAAATRASGPGDNVEKRQKIAQAARLAAIKYYRALTDQYPKLCAVGTPPATSGCIDEVLYSIALEYIRSGDLMNARLSLMLLIKDWPASAKLGHAYFLFGELFRNESKNDPSKLSFSEQAYAKAAEIKGPMRGPALERTAQAQEAQGKTSEAAATRAKLAKVASP